MTVCNYEINNEDGSIRVNCLNCVYSSSIEDIPACMERTITKLIENPHTTKVILSQNREFEYDEKQTRLLKQIADAVVFLVKTARVTSPSNLATPGCDKCIPQRLALVQDMVTSHIRSDPIGAYVRAVREARLLKKQAEKMPPECRKCTLHFLEKSLGMVIRALESTDLIQMVKDELVGYHIGDRTLYRRFFKPVIRPNFMLTRYMITPPKNSQKIDSYKLPSGTRVEIYRVSDQIQKFYHVIPPEFNLGEIEYGILDTARRYMSAHKPTRTEFAKPELMRQIFSDIGKDMISEIAISQNHEIDPKTLRILAEILTRYTAGYGILEILLEDPNVQDIYINAPPGESPIFLYHGKHEECITNIIPSREDAEAWATRFRITSGRPLDEANPVLDTEIEVPGGRARIAAVTRSLSPHGLTYAIRRHREKPWTYPLFIKQKMLTPLAAGLLSFIVDGARTMLIAGTRSAGKSSLLGATLTELMKKVRIITVEDTLELPVNSLRRLGYDIQALKSRSILTNVESEVPADEAIRTSLRLGDSCLIVGEVRSVEAKALYESMRIGALANLVAGTIHGDSPYGVYDRVVNDLGVPPTSFKATDIIVIANRLRSPDGLSTYRRVVEIVEVTKDWDHDPRKEKGFQPLMVYNAKKDMLEPTEYLLNGESFVLNEIANKVREWKDDWSAVWSNIMLRTKIKKTIVEYARQHNLPDLLEAEFVVPANDMFHIISEEVSKEYGWLDPDRIFSRWDDWARQKIEEIKRHKKIERAVSRKMF